MDKPITVQRFECLAKLVDVLNDNSLPAFVKVEIMERILNELRPEVDAEYQRDIRAYQNKEG